MTARGKKQSRRTKQNLLTGIGRSRYRCCETARQSYRGRARMVRIPPAMEITMSEVREVYPYLRVQNAAEAIEFYTRAFAAKELFCLFVLCGRFGLAVFVFGSVSFLL